MKKLMLFFYLLNSACFGSGYDLFINPPSGVQFKSFAPTDDGGFILCGDIATNLTSDSRSFYFARYDSTGNVVWTKQFYDTTFFNNHGLDICQAKEIVTSLNGGFIFIGSVFSYYYDRISYVGRLDSSGNLVNSITYWGEVYASGDQIKKCNDSSYVYTFHEYEGAGNGYEGLVKIDDNLNNIWSKEYGYGIYIKHALSIGPDNSIHLLVDGSIVVAGSIYEYAPMSFRINQNGSLLSQFVFGADSLNNGGVSFNYASTQAITGTTDNGMLITGVKNNGGNENISLMYVDSTGDSLWTKYYGGPMKDNAFDIILCSDSGFVLTGYTGDSCASPFTDIFLMKLDKNTDSLWTRTYRGTSTNRGTTVQHSPDGGYMIFGYSDSLTRIIKTDENGLIVFPFTLSSGQLCEIYCDGDTARLGVNEPAASYQWSSGQTSSSIDVTESGLYFVNVTDFNGENYTLNSPFISFTPFPSTHFTSDTIHICDSYLAFTNSSAIPGYSFQWYRNDTLIPFATDATYNITESAKYSVITSTTCGSDTADFYGLVHQRPARPDIIPNMDLFVCAGDSTRIYTNANATSYQWYRGNNYDTIPGATNFDYYAVVPTGYEYYTVEIRDSNGCTAKSQMRTIFSLSPRNNIPIGHSTSLKCPGDSVQLWCNANYYNSYLWNTGDTVRYTYAKQPGYYYLVMNLGTSCESYSDTILIEFHPIVPANLGPDTIVCTGTNLILTAGPANSMYTYQWQDSSILNFLQVNTSQQDSLQFEVVMRDTITSCRATDSIIVIIDNCLDVEKPLADKLALSPNPCNTYFEINGKITGEIELSIMSVDGKKIIQQTLHDDNRQINISELPAGIYCVRIGKNGIWKIIKE